jgi:hypothetical protein
VLQVLCRRHAVDTKSCGCACVVLRCVHSMKYLQLLVHIMQANHGSNPLCLPAATP